jgi:NADH-ubiquinone oxidoreductase chain 6
MLLTNIITTFFSLLFVFTAISVILSKNPIYSVLSLIACFFNATSLLFVLGIEFIPVSFIVIYVGAIAVLFLFVLMMLNLKASELNQGNNLIMPILMILFFAFCLQYFVLFNESFYCLNTNYNLIFFFEFINSFHLSHFVS